MISSSKLQEVAEGVVSQSAPSEDDLVACRKLAESLQKACRKLAEDLAKAGIKRAETPKD